MQKMRLLTLFLLIVSVAACKPVSQNERAVTLVREANDLLRQSTDSTGDWTSEYGKTFTPQNRAQFPANREQLKTAAEKINKSLDETTSLNDSALEKYEQALALMKEGPEKQGMTMLVSATKKQSEVNGIIKSQLQLVYDEKITDEQTFNQRFLEFLEQYEPLQREYMADLREGRRLLGK